MNKLKLQDLTVEMSSELTVFPGDPAFEKQVIVKLDDKNNHYCLSKISLSNHLGTHIDFPAHVMRGGKTSSDYSHDDLQGDGLIIEVPSEHRSINLNFLKEYSFFQNDIIFFKTNNSNLSKTGNFSDHAVYIEPEAAEFLVESKVKIVGIDYLSVDQYSAIELPVHHILLSNNILIIENLDLKNTTQGRYQFLIIPSFKIAGMDGLQVRVFVVNNI